MTAPAVLRTPETAARNAAVAARAATLQSGRGEETRYRQLRHGDPTDRADLDPGGAWTGVRPEVHEYDGPFGRGWLAITTHTVAARDSDSGEAETWTYTHHVGPEDRATGWQRVAESDPVDGGR